MIYKLVVVDMDGTLLDSNKKISAPNKEALKKAADKGVIIAMATGRLYKAIRVYAKELQLETPIISCNGSFIKEVYGEKPIYADPLSAEVIDTIAGVCKKYGIDCHFYSEDTVIGERESFKIRFFRDWNQTLAPEDRVNLLVVPDYRQVIADYEIYKISVCIDCPPRLQAVADELNSLPGIEALQSDAETLDVGSVGMSKGKAVQWLAESLSISPDEVVAIGDNENDIDMIVYAGLGVAMGNASPEVKAAARYVTDTNDNDGVATVLHKFVL